jgi:peptidoglycan/xylan/chitin deacetylase (PgdA/CDA1 family)
MVMGHLSHICGRRVHLAEVESKYVIINIDGMASANDSKRHLNGEQDYEYGSRCGAWRILRLMKEFGWNMTLWAIAVAMERNPTFAKACVRDGHEIGAHGYRWLDIWDYSLEEDKAYIKKTCKALEAATGEFCSTGTTLNMLTDDRRIPGWSLFRTGYTKYSQSVANHVEGNGTLDALHLGSLQRRFAVLDRPPMGERSPYQGEGRIVDDALQLRL